jgi:hypothetical protein
MKWTHIGWDDDTYNNILEYGKENGIKSFTGSVIYIVTQFFKFIKREK